jgi:opacity protein-like surface antigen
MKRILIAAAAAACSFVATLGASAVLAPAASSHQLSGCVAGASVPYVDSSAKEGFAQGGPNGCTGGSWVGELDFRNNAGSNLMSNYIAGSSSGFFYGTPAGCAGATVHTFVYVIDGGHGTSDTSGVNHGCEY